MVWATTVVYKGASSWLQMRGYFTENVIACTQKHIMKTSSAEARLPVNFYNTKER